jgi:DTW domain-containing protein YfiP
LAKVGKNLEGHPNSEAQLRTRFNAMKHGMAAKTATYFPARPDKYSFCERCEVNRTWCAAQAACVKQTELFMLHHAAFETRNPRVLAGLHADLQAGLTAMLQMLMQQVLGYGVVRCATWAPTS